MDDGQNTRQLASRRTFFIVTNGRCDYQGASRDVDKRGIR
jgi:hypothetical protein